MKLRNLFMAALLASASSLIACGDDEQATGGTTGAGGSGGAAGSVGTSGNGGNGDAGGIGGSVDTDPCTLGRCMNNETLRASCLDEYNACVGRGHYEWACRDDADETCGI